MDEGEGSVFLDNESGTGLTETSDYIDENRPDFWDKAEAEFSVYNEPVDDKILDEDLGLSDERKTPEGQVINNEIVIKVSHVTSHKGRERDCDPRHRILPRRGGLPDGRGEQPGRPDLNKRKEVQWKLNKTEFLLNLVQSYVKDCIYHVLFFLCPIKVFVKSLDKVTRNKKLTKTGKLRKDIRKDLLNRAANRAGKKTWTGIKKRQDKTFNRERKDTTIKARTLHRSGQINLINIIKEDKRGEDQQRPRRPNKTFQTNPVGTKPAPRFSSPTLGKAPPVLKRLWQKDQQRRISCYCDKCKPLL